MRLQGQRPSQEVKCLTVGNRLEHRFSNQGAKEKLAQS
ncbi:hypothetical protein COO91_10110 (plasmid) [Nostoc flagelliforme CCNUN1]|uniref:Uncharacterized protein n=1 Tax=Nostoc flagelliforme CCNUN1 TaxID=2038116 RepID=A0A2K8T8B6_9NOSO|nr:hypothetical protein COO91_10110 [Nostoc flagelliforme CCNUN1]